MIPAIVNFVKAILFDPSAAQRFLGLACYLIGDWLASGGVLPGTNVVLPVPDAINFSSKGALMKAIAIYLSAGGKLPSLSAPATPAPVDPKGP